ncbi:surface-adhesin E family protein [Burkholderia ubonensis]|uniref:surface-adhesin E family protein n=1 Tax=Burkholderia ubonensis TaxID=101571 RepID=UPI000A825F3C|nr:surface-adhesin E family protein [Burkholderia ubonensis]
MNRLLAALAVVLAVAYANVAFGEAYNPASEDTAGRLRALGVLPSYSAPAVAPEPDPRPIPDANNVTEFYRLSLRKLPSYNEAISSPLWSYFLLRKAGSRYYADVLRDAYVQRDTHAARNVLADYRTWVVGFNLERWRYIGVTNSGMMMLIDPVSLASRNIGSKVEVRAWLRSVYLTEDAIRDVDAHESTMHVSFFCSEHAFQALGSDAYWANGRHLRHTNESPDRRQITPGSIMEGAFNEACFAKH